MTLYIASVVALTVILIVQSATYYLHTKSQQRTIERLTDRLMAKDYREYKNLNTPPPDEPKTREPMSAFDDPYLPGDEDDEAH